MFRKQFSFPVIAANNVRSYANAYAFLQHDSKLQNMLFIRNEATMGVSLILNGQFYGGDRNLAAGIAHFTVVPNGRKCHCGKRGCLDTIASQDGMMRVSELILEKRRHRCFMKRSAEIFRVLLFPCLLMLHMRETAVRQK